MIPGEIIISSSEIECNKGKVTKQITVTSNADRPIQVGSHFHFFEVNKMLNFDREAAFGMRLNIASGTAVRFEPGEEKSVELVELGGKKEVYGLNGLTQGSTLDPDIKEKSLKKARELGFKGVK
ncbi:urease subunit beta [Clostridium akagii]|uniref:urease subunit beta n=1 Tax=Clostridium akagii TaxID=91623 RepID=UPI00047B665C|nr:urease subunit beta [Clostridium akagii]